MVTQFFLVGIGLFGMKAGDTIGKAHSLNAHREFGWALTQYGGLLLLLTTLIAWQKPLRERVGLYVVLCLLGFPVQPLLAAGGEHHKLRCFPSDSATEKLLGMGVRKNVGESSSRRGTKGTSPAFQRVRTGVYRSNR